MARHRSRGRGREHGQVVVYTPPAAEDVAARAARLGITEERVLRECARLAFANICQIVEWDADGIMTARSGLDEDVIAAIAEVVASAATGKIYRVKMHDKKPVLDALARYLGMLPPLLQTAPHDATELDEDPRERLIRAIDHLAAEEAAGSGDPEATP